MAAVFRVTFYFFHSARPLFVLRRLFENSEFRELLWRGRRSLGFGDKLVPCSSGPAPRALRQDSNMTNYLLEQHQPRLPRRKCPPSEHLHYIFTTHVAVALALQSLRTHMLVCSLRPPFGVCTFHNFPRYDGLSKSVMFMCAAAAAVD